MKHRFEPVHHAAADDMESWSNLGGDVLLLRRTEDKEWVAFVDFIPVADAERVHGPLALQPDVDSEAAMKARDPRLLAAKLARQEHIHILFDAA